MRSFIVLVITVFILPTVAGAVSLKQRELGTSGGFVESYEVPGTEGMSEMEVISTLKKDIALLDEEISSCNRKRKGWVAATVAGGVGVVGTGIAALVQNKHRKDTKAEIEEVKGKIAGTEQEINSAKEQLTK